MGNARDVNYIKVCYVCHAARPFKAYYGPMGLWLFGLTCHRIKGLNTYSWTIDSVCMDCDPEYC